MVSSKKLCILTHPSSRCWDRSGTFVSNFSNIFFLCKTYYWTRKVLVSFHRMCLFPHTLVHIDSKRFSCRLNEFHPYQHVHGHYPKVLQVCRPFPTPRKWSELTFNNRKKKKKKERKGLILCE